MDSKDTFTFFSSWLQGKERHKALNANVFEFVMDFFFLTTQAIKEWSLDFPSKVLSSSYFSIHHTGEINLKKFLCFLLSSCVKKLVYAFSSSGVCGSSVKTCRGRMCVKGR